MACSPEPIVASDLYLALGGISIVDPDTLCDGIECGFDDVDQVQDVKIELDGVVEVTEIGATNFTMNALGKGETLVTVIGTDHEGEGIDRHAQAIVRSVHQFDFVPLCDVTEPSEAPWIVPPSSELYVQWGLWDSDSNQLAGEPEFETGDVTTDLDLDNQDGVFSVPEDPGSTELSSPLYDGTVATIEVHQEGDFDGFEAQWWPEESIEIGAVQQISTAMLVDGRRVCLDTEERVAQVMTEETCSFDKEERVLEILQETPTVRVFGLAEGVCTVMVLVPAYDYVETLSIDVMAPVVDPAGE